MEDAGRSTTNPEENAGDEGGGAERPSIVGPPTLDGLQVLARSLAATMESTMAASMDGFLNRLDTRLASIPGPAPGGGGTHVTSVSDGGVGTTRRVTPTGSGTTITPTAGATAGAGTTASIFGE